MATIILSENVRKTDEMSFIAIFVRIKQENVTSKIH